MATLQSLPFLEPGSIEAGPSTYSDQDGQDLPAIAVSVECKAFKKRCIGLFLVNDRLVEIRININYNLLLKDLVKQFGTPDYVRSARTVESTTCSLFLTWEKQQIFAISRVPDGRELCESIENGGGLDENLGIGGVFYQLPGFIQYESQYGKSWPGFKEP